MDKAPYTIEDNGRDHGRDFDALGPALDTARRFSTMFPDHRWVVRDCDGYGVFAVVAGQVQ